jgi:hypothetical protein
MPAEIVETTPVDNPVQRALDEAYPLTKDQSGEPTESVKTTEPVKTEQVKTETAKPTESKLPSFLDSVATPAKTETVPAAAESEWPEELPGTKDEKAKANYKKWRQEYHERGQQIQTLKSEVEAAKKNVEKPLLEVQEKLKSLQQENANLSARLGVENHPEVLKIRSQRQGAINYANKLITDAGGVATDLQKALNLTGKEQYDALDQIYSSLPESAKSELSTVVRDIKLLNQRHDAIFADVSKSAEQLHKRDLEQQKSYLEKEREDMGKTVNDVITEMREVHKVPLLVKGNDPAWNEKIDKIEAGARETLLNNPNFKRLAAAVVMGHMVDEMFQLLSEVNTRRVKAEARLKEIDDAHPTIETEGGISGVLSQKENGTEDFGEAGLRYLRKSRQQA